MSTKAMLLELLKQKENEYVSGQALAEALGVTRNSVWKASMALKSEGYRIDASSGVGYRLRTGQDVLSGEVLKDRFGGVYDFTVLDSVDSTNSYAKSLPRPIRPRIVISNEQTGGRGRQGRSFFSPVGSGLYMTISYQPGFSVDNAMFVTAMTALAVSRAISLVSGIQTKIKWVNDLYIRDKKVAGILTEAETSFEDGRITVMHVGIGVNCFASAFPEEIAQDSTWLIYPKTEFSRSQLAEEIIKQFFAISDAVAGDPASKSPLLREYRTKCFMLGSQITIHNPALERTAGRPSSRGAGIRARAIDIDDNGGLIVEYLEGRRMHEMVTLTTGEVTVRPV